MQHTADHIQKLTTAGLNLITQAISIYDSDLQLVLANAQVQKMFGLPSRLVESGASFEDTIRHLADRQKPEGSGRPCSRDSLGS